MNERFLELELRLLILGYGRQKVLLALASLGEQTPQELEQQLRAAEEKRKAQRPKRSILELVTSESSEHPEIAEPLRLLGVAFQNRTFLPQLRDVQRFLDRIGLKHGKLKSREAAAPVLFRLLGKLTRDELLPLVSNGHDPGESDYARLAREIMKPSAKEHRDVVEPRDKPSKR
jgi:hypothetical protein